MAEMLSLYIKTIDGLLTKQPIKMQSDQPYLPKKIKKNTMTFFVYLTALVYGFLYSCYTLRL